MIARCEHMCAGSFCHGYAVPPSLGGRLFVSLMITQIGREDNLSADLCVADRRGCRFLQIYKHPYENPRHDKRSFSARSSLAQLTEGADIVDKGREKPHGEAEVLLAEAEFLPQAGAAGIGADAGMTVIEI